MVVRNPPYIPLDIHHLFVDFKAAFESTDKSCLFGALSKFGIPVKLITVMQKHVDIDIIVVNNIAVSSVFSRLGKESKDVGLMVNEGNKKYQVLRVLKNLKK